MLTRIQVPTVNQVIVPYFVFTEIDDMITQVWLWTSGTDMGIKNIGLHPVTYLLVKIPNFVKQLMIFKQLDDGKQTIDKLMTWLINK